MAILNGSEVRHRAAELVPADFDAKGAGARDAARHLVWLAEQSGLPVGTIHNVTRDHNPQGLSLDRIYQLAAPLRRPDEGIRDAVAAILATEQPNQPQPQPEQERPRDPSGPPNRTNGDDDHRGPKRSVDLRQAS